jgi:MoxR-like ATPase
MILLQSFIEGTSYQIRPLSGQDFEKSLTRKVEDMKITASVADFARFPLGTVFIANSFEFPETDHMHIAKDAAMPLFFGESVFPLSSVEVLGPIVEYTVDYMLGAGNETYGIDKAKAFAKACEAYGYTCDVDAKLTIPTETAPGSTSTGMRRSIAAKYPVPTIDEIGFQIDPDMWNLMVRNVLRGENTLLVGPTGSGKTEILSHLAKALERELHIQDMGTVQDAQSALLGVHRLNKEGVSDFDFAPFVSHIRSGGIVLLDELNRSPLAANNILFPCLDKRRYLPVDIACDECDRKIMVHPDTVFFATANLGSEYSGTQAIDRALLDRFFPIELSYPSEKDEVRVLMHRTGIDEKSATGIVRVSNNIRQQYKEQELSNAVSVRHTLQAAGLIADGFEPSKALQHTILPLFEDGIGVTERSKVLSIMAAF